jgi:16S rRNA processing protein RimM
MTTETSFYAIVGRIRGAHGIRGQVTVELFTDEPDAIFAPGRRVFAGTTEGDIAPHPDDNHNPDSRHPITIHSTTPFKNGLIVQFDAISDRTTAELWHHRYLLVPIDELTPPVEDEVFIHDLVGMTVVSQDGTPLGHVISFYELPQGLTLEVKTPSGESLLPYRPELIHEVDRTARTITVDASNGLFD